MGYFVFNEVIERKMSFFIFHFLKTKTSTRAKLASLFYLFFFCICCRASMGAVSIGLF